jgi:hypothetical protein
MEDHFIRKQVREDGLADRALAAALERHGLLLLQDKTLPSVVGIITGERVAGSWWSHPLAQEIFRRLEELSAGGDARSTKLIGGKVTFVHRRLWPALFAVGSERADWQIRALPLAARRLLARVDQAGSTQTSGPAAKELQKRLLVDAAEEHTASGKHVIVLSPWPRSSMRASTARRRLEDAATAIGAEQQLPWNR